MRWVPVQSAAMARLDAYIYELDSHRYKGDFDLDQYQMEMEMECCRAVILLLVTIINPLMKPRQNFVIIKIRACFQLPLLT